MKMLGQVIRLGTRLVWPCWCLFEVFSPIGLCWRFSCWCCCCYHKTTSLSYWCRRRWSYHFDAEDWVSFWDECSNSSWYRCRSSEVNMMLWLPIWFSKTISNYIKKSLKRNINTPMNVMRLTRDTRETNKYYIKFYELSTQTKLEVSRLAPINYTILLWILSRWYKIL